MSTSKRIVIVEDEADLAELLAYNLRRAGYETEVCRDGLSGLRRISEIVPDLVVLDVMIPHMSGLQVAKQLRTNPKTARTPILMLTASEEQVARALESGANDFVMKPVALDSFLAAARRLIARGDTEVEREEPPRVLVVIDRNTHALIIVGTALHKQSGQVVHLARGAEDGLRRVGETQPDVVLLDWGARHLPDGTDLLRRLEHLMPPPAVILAAEATELPQARLLQSPLLRGVLPRPYNPMDITKSVLGLLGLEAPAGRGIVVADKHLRDEVQRLMLNASPG